MLRALLREKWNERKARKEERERNHEKRQDDNLPLGLKLSTRVKLDDTPYLLLPSCHASFPAEHMRVTEYGRFPFFDYDAYRFYLETEPDAAERKDAVALIMCEAGSIEPKGVMLFGDVAIYEVQDAPDFGCEEEDFWDKFVDETGILAADEITEIPGVVIKTPFKRVWTHMRPFAEFEEELRDDPYSKAVTNIRQYAMLFGHMTENELDEPVTEYLLISVEDDGERVIARVQSGLDYLPSQITLR